jgi:integrase/recombinase XerD
MGTVALYSACARRFVNGLALERELSGVVVGDVTAAVVRESERVSVSATQNFVNGMRAFLGFCFVEG